ncbi:MlaD family protein [Nocardioides caeni]|uniref:MCE family protein n=1 Tax=Nocardioides caeni TaxID=574700 RepID=A0A4S8MZE5_9ACTN|nr:MlaD family protein [Nocardioides caeni]THV08850.1 MCE family protein [Nocardioides caeni]
MRIPYQVVPKLRGLTLVAFLAVCATIFSFLWLQAGGKLPLLSKAGYQVTVPYDDVDNLVFQSDVRIAGVEVGQVERIEVDGDKAMVTLELDEDVVPLHEGATITVRNKTMIEETYLEIVDGTGAAYDDGATLPASVARGSVQLNDVLTSLDTTTRRDLSRLIRSGGAATKGTREDVDAVLAGLGDLGENAGALEALAAQSEDLRSLVRSSTTVLDALDVQQGRIVDLTRDAQTLTAVTAGHEEDVRAIMRSLPPLLVTTERASNSLADLTAPLATVSRNLRKASPDLSAALLELPATTEDLRGMLPSLDTTLDRAPASLTRLSPLQEATSPLLQTLQVNLADLNPMLAYLQPYGPDLVSYWTNFIGFVGSADGNGPIARVKPILGVSSLNLPVGASPTTMYNPYPSPGTHHGPAEFTGEYPRIHEDPIP